MIQYEFKLFRGSEETEMEEYMKLKTQAYKDGANLTVVKEETKLTESGEYLIALHWISDGASSEEKDTIKEMLEDKI